MTLETLIADWGLPALFLGGVFEGDGAGMVGGALAHRGAFPLPSAWAAISAGAFLADQVLFQIARRHRQMPRLQRLAATAAAAPLLALAARRPALASMSFRFLFGMRTIGPLVLGLSAIPARLYLVVNLLAVALWGALVTALGYGAGHVLEQLFGRLDTVRHLGLILGLTAALLAAAAFLHHRLRRRREKP